MSYSSVLSMLFGIMSFIVALISGAQNLFVGMAQQADFSPFLSGLMSALPIIVIVGIIGLIMKNLDRGF